MKNKLETKTVSLIVTEKCNLSCIYCYEDNKSKSNMSFNTAKEILDYELTNLPKVENLYIDFFGGEPFCNFELIKQDYEYVMSFYDGKIRFFATTNGTLIHGDIQKWLEERKDYFSVGLSFDGTKEAHNLNRSESFDEIDLDFFLRNYPEQSVKMTVSEKTLPLLAESVKYVTKLGFKVSCNLAYMVDWLAENNRKILEEQLNELITFYLENSQYEVCSMLNYKIEELARPEEDSKVIQKYCGAGTAMHCYDIFGNVYPCQLFAPISAGDRAKKLGEIEIRNEYPKENLDKKCQGCYYQRICPNCLGSNYLSMGDLFLVNDDRCGLYKIIFKAVAKLKALQWKKGQLTFIDDQEQALLRSILEIQNL